MTQEDDKRRSGERVERGDQQEKDTVRPPPVPRPADVHPVNAVSGTPPPVELFLEETPTKLMMHQDILNALSEVDEQTRDKSSSKDERASHPVPHHSPVSQPPSRPPKPASGPPRPELSGLARHVVSRGTPRPSRPSRGALSLKPPPVVLPDEPSVGCPSATELSERGLAELMRQRVEGLELQAELQRDPVHRARLMVIASELRAMLGQTGRARMLAEQAGKLGNYVGQRQARQLAQLQGDTKAVSSALAAEVHTAPTADIKAHAALTHAEYERLQNKDALAAGRSLEQAQRSSPLDPRPGLFKLARQLGSSPKPPSLKWPEDAAFESLARATAATAQLRGDTRAKFSPDSAPVAIFLDAQRALARRDRQAAANALLHLRKHPGFERSVPWLCAALLAPLPETRPRAATLLTELLQERPTRTIRRALAARALELGDAQAAALALGDGDVPSTGESAFSPGDVLSIRALCHSSVGATLSELIASGPSENLLPLMHAVALCANEPTLVPSLPSLPARLVRAAHDLALPEIDMATIDAAREAEPSDPVELAAHPLLVALGLERAVLSSNVKEVAQLLLSMPQPPDTEQSAHLQYAAALVLEHAGETGLALEHYGRALEQRHCGEAALRALLDLVEPERQSALLEQFAQRSDNPEQRALLLAQAALTAESPADCARLCMAAHAAAPDHVIVEALVQRFGSEVPFSDVSIQENDEIAALKHQRALLLSRRAQHGATEFERALAHVRQVYAGHTVTDVAYRLEQAWGLWPRDLTLLDLREQHSDLPLEAKAKAREELASRLPASRSQACLRLESALFYELAGLAPNAAHLAQNAAEQEPLAALCFARTAPGTEAAGKLREWVSHQAHTASSEIEQAEWWLLASRLASDAGAHSAEREAIMQAVILDPRHLEALLTAESLAFRDGAWSRIADVEKRLADVLQGPALDAHAQLAARFEQLEHGWAAGYTALQMCDKGDETPVQVVRRLASLARRAGDDDRYYRMLTILLRQTARPHDQAVLLLRSAEVAMRLGKPGSALTHLDDAVGLAPGYTSALVAKANTLAEQQYHAAAAEAYERVAFAATSPVLRGAAFKQAAMLLMREPEPTEQNIDPPVDAVKASRPADPTRVKINLERALEAAPDDDQTLDLLVRIYTLRGAREQLDELFSRRLEQVSDEQRAAVELRWSQACVELGAPHRAREIVDRVLKRTPDNPQALTQLVELTTDDTATHEQALLQLVRVTADPKQQSAAYKQLGFFYWRVAPQPVRALRCFHEAFARNPHDRDAFEALIDVALEHDAVDQATTAVAAFAARPQLSEADDRILALAQAKVSSAQAPETGEQVFADLLARWPLDEKAIGGMARLFQRTNQTDKIERLVDDLRGATVRQLPTGELLSKCLATLAYTAELTRDASAHALTVAVSNLFHEQPSGLDARGSRAMSRTLDSLLAPAPLGTALLGLLSHTTLALERALPLDLDGLQAAELTDLRVRASFDMKARAMGLGAPELLIVRTQPYACLVTQEPARVVLGSAWVDLSSPSALDFVTWRALKVLQCRLGPVAALPAATLLSHIEALLSGFIDTAQSGLSAYRSDSLCKRLHPQLRKEADVASLAQQALEELDGNETALADAIALWVNRCSLLAVGELRAAVHGIAMLHGELPPPGADGITELLRRVPEATRLVASMLSAEMASGHRAIH